MGKEKRPFCCHKIFVPNGLSAPACIHLAIYMWKKHKHTKTGKNQLQSDFFLNWLQMGKVIRNFCWHQNFVPKGLSVPALGLYTCIKSFKLCLKSYFKEIVLKLATNGQSDKGFLLTSTFVPKGFVYPCPGVIHMYKSIKIYTRTRCLVSVYRTTGPLVLHWNLVSKISWKLFELGHWYLVYWLIRNEVETTWLTFGRIL